MTRYLLGPALLLAWAAPCRATNEPGALQVSNDGLVSFSAASGATTWTGTMAIDYPRFHVVAKGTAALFGGPALRRTSGQNVSLKTATFKAETQWISLVVLGDITITVRDANDRSSIVTARRVVYMPGQDRLLIDGKAWPAHK